ncbi:MAG: hypothetical protein LBC56_07345 [Oscillospiraceae bacterium]|jgi:sporulation integral membrane protein YlbJ|nr:hypothetical protein [Oscillospiraceae bacterium]
MYAKSIQKAGDFLVLLMTITAAAMFFMAGDSIPLGVSEGLDVCVSVIIPSLFPFMIFSSFLLNSGIAAKISKFFAYPAVKILKLPEAAAAPFLLSLIGGFPVGAKLVNQLRRDKILSRREARRMALYCVGAGPAFLITAVGAKMLGSARLGLMLFAAQTCASVVLAVFCGIGEKLPAEKQHEAVNPAFPQSGFSASLVDAALSSLRAMAAVCAFVTVFSALMSILSRSRVLAFVLSALPEELRAFAEALICGILEVTRGCLLAAKLPGFWKYPLICFMLSFSGFSVIFQIFANSPHIKIQPLPFILARLAHGTVSTGIFLLLLRIFPAAARVSLSGDSYTPRLSGSGPASFMLFIMALLLIFSDKNSKKT